MSETLLITKLTIPPVRAALVTRPRLVSKIGAGQPGRLTLISAPAGSGKTTLLASWLYQSQTAGAWLSLDAEDNDLLRFWGYVIAALQTILPDELVANTAAALNATPPPPIESILTGLINALATASTPITLVLDDYHLIDQQPIHQSLAFLLDHLSASLHLIIASRTDPPLPLARLRVRGQLTELTTADLRFTREEATAFLNDVMGLRISADEAAALETRTEGWIAALQIAALSLQGRADTTAFIQQFQGSHRYLLDYLAEEVLRQQPPAVQQFLLHTSILDRFNASLCDAVTQTTIAQGMLKRLERANLFLVPLDDDRHWYRYHHLFADFLRSHLQLEDSEAVSELHRRASAWLETNGFTETAVDHALAAEDYQRAAHLMAQSVRNSFRQRTSIRIYRWLRRLPEDVVSRRPYLGLAYAWGLCWDGQYQAGEGWLTVVEDQLRQVADTLPPHLPRVSDAMRGEIETVRAVMACFQGDMAAALARSHRALTQLPPDEHVLRGLLANNMAMNIADAVGGSGDLATAGRICTEAAAAGRASGNKQVTVFALNRLAEWQMGQGQLHQAGETFREVLQLEPTDNGRWLSGEIGVAHLGLGELAYQWNQLTEAQQHLQTGCESVYGGNSLFLPPAYATWAFVMQAHGEIDKARQWMAQAVNMARDSNITWMISNVTAAQARLALFQGDLETALRWADTCGLDVGDELGINRLSEYTTLARIHTAQGNTAVALDLLAWLYDFVTLLKLKGYRLEILLLQSLAHHAQGERPQAEGVLAQTMALAAPEGYMRLFLDEGEPMVQLLGLVQTEDARLAHYVARLHRAFAEAGIGPAIPSLQPLLDPLSEREIEVLRLLAADLSSPEIADELTIAVSTVRSHIKNIYSKLNAHSRYEAVVRAKEWQLL